MARRVQPWPKKLTDYIAALKKCVTSIYLTMDICIEEWEKDDNRQLAQRLFPQLMSFTLECMNIAAGLQDFIPLRRGTPPLWVLNVQEIDVLGLEIMALIEAAAGEYKRKEFQLVLRRLQAARDKARSIITLINEVPMNKRTEMPEVFVEYINNLIDD